MQFKIGQTVELINNDGMVAPLGAIAIVTKVMHSSVNIVWVGYVNCQMDGNYHLSHFKSLVRKNQQLLFSFMDEQ